MDVSRSTGRVELSMSADLIRRRGTFLAALGAIALAGGSGALAMGMLRVGGLIALVIGAICLPIGLYFVVFASRVSDQRHVAFDRERQTVVGGRGARTVMFRAIEHLAVLRTAQIHALEIVLKNGSTWRLHAESTQSPDGCDGIARAATQIAEETGLPLR